MNPLAEVIPAGGSSLNLASFPRKEITNGLNFIVPANAIAVTILGCRMNASVCARSHHCAAGSFGCTK